MRTVTFHIFCLNFNWIMLFHHFILHHLEQALKWVVCHSCSTSRSIWTKKILVEKSLRGKKFEFFGDSNVFRSIFSSLLGLSSFKLFCFLKSNLINSEVVCFSPWPRPDYFHWLNLTASKYNARHIWCFYGPVILIFIFIIMATSHYCFTFSSYLGLPSIMKIFLISRLYSLSHFHFSDHFHFSGDLYFQVVSNCQAQPQLQLQLQLWLRLVLVSTPQKPSTCPDKYCTPVPAQKSNLT